ncbi:hypothetical protein [Pseudomonas sp. P9_31]|uniref:hypothetical protein n=1 Tax=Pseudomonas sp. P9_31 TaxID=3043448 RepID=UPI002A36E25F|nr:hypothetical protein [Pseudomonas sp. P9_31]WPN57851.1 hypothetical protein QMK51_27690 [Pseudomonas sp. P9_31]
MNDVADEMRMLSRAQLSFFMVALWWPLLAVLTISSYQLWIGEYTTFDSSHTHWEYLLWWGIPGLLGFSLWMSRSAKSRNEQQALRMVWWAPVKFIPFYIVPWVIYGVCCLIAGQSQDAYMAFGLIMLVPYLLIGGYVCAGLTVALYRTIFS